MTIDANALTLAVAAVCPITGVSIGDPADRATWRIDFEPGATRDQQQAARDALRDWNPDRVAVPDNPTLSDYRVALTLWGRIDDVSARIAALIASTDPRQAMLGKIAKERFEYANTVQRAQLLQLKDALGFTAADVDESLWRAAQVAQGDLSGVWPPKT